MKTADANTGFLSLSPSVGLPNTGGSSTDSAQPVGVKHPLLKSFKRTVIGSIDDLAMAASRALNKKAQAAVPSGADPVDKPSHEEYNVRKERIRKLLGTAIGTGYGSVAGGMLGGTTFGNGRGFDKQTALKGMIMGALGGGAAGYTAGSVLNRMKRYTGEHNAPAPQSTIQIVVPPSPAIIQQVTDAMKSGSAVARTVGIFAGIKVAGIEQNPLTGVGKSGYAGIRPPPEPEAPAPDATGMPDSKKPVAAVPGYEKFRPGNTGTIGLGHGAVTPTTIKRTEQNES